MNGKEGAYVTLKENFIRVFNKYPSFSKDGTGKMSGEVPNLIKRIIPQEIVRLLNINTDKYKVTGSVGIGVKTETPWIAIFDRQITESAQRGFYLVFLFKSDMSGVYLSLNQGATYLQHKFRGHKPREKMIRLSEQIREQLPPLPNEFDIGIELISKQNNAQNYVSANIAAKYYSAVNFPDDQTLKDDMLLVLGQIDDLKKYIGSRSLDQTIDELLIKDDIDDLKFQEDVFHSVPSATPEQPQKKPAKIAQGSVGKGQYVRDPKVAREALEKSHYQCEFDNSHITFISPITKKMFMEAHHLIPFKYQDNFNVSIDVPGNIVSLCPNCHRKIHHASNTEKRIMLKALLNKRIETLRIYGISIQLKDLYKWYDV